MSTYQVIARKYRPQTWSTVIGQEHVTTTLANALTSGRLHHAYLFCGARGVGKTTVARILAKAVNCAARTADGAPCNVCVSCEGITNGSSLDVREIDGASHNGVESVREICEQIQYLPNHEHYKIYIIDEVHMLSKPAFNALLKTLEEPPAHALFVFATTDPHKILPTILSRCQRYDFRRVSVQRIVEQLRDIAAQESVQAADDVLHLLAFEADGSLRDAESLLDQAIAYGGRAITIAQVRELLGLADRSLVMALVQAVCARHASAALQALAAVQQVGGSLTRLAQDLLEIFRHLWVIASCGALPNASAVTDADAEQLTALARGATLEEFQQWFTLLFRGQNDVTQGRFPSLAMEALLLQMVQVRPVESVGALLEQVERLMKNDVPERPPAVPTRDARRETRDVSWPTFLAAVSSAKPQLASILSHGNMRRADSEIVLLEFPRDSLYAEMLKDTDRAQQLSALLQQHFGPRCRVEIVMSSGPSGPEAQAALRTERTAAQKQRHEVAVQHELVQEAAKIFGAEIKSVKVFDPS